MLALPDADLARVEQIIDEEINAFVKDGPTTEELARGQAKFEPSLLSRLQSVGMRIVSMNTSTTLAIPTACKRDLGRYRKATPASIKAWSGRDSPQRCTADSSACCLKNQIAATGRDKRPADFAKGDVHAAQS